MHRRLLLITLLAVPLLPSSSWAQTPSEQGLDIAKKLRGAREGFASDQSGVEMVLTDANGASTMRKMSIKTVEVAGDGDRTRMEVTWPADVAGTRLLTWTHPDKQDDQWLFLPTVSSVKRIAGGNKSASFMGSEFSFEDFSGFEIDKFEYTFLGEDTVDGHAVWKVQQIPTDPKSGYSKQIMFADQEYLAARKMEFYDRKGELLKVAYYSDFVEDGGFWAALVTRMVNQQTKKESVIKLVDRAVGDELDPALFQSHALGD